MALLTAAAFRSLNESGGDAEGARPLPSGVGHSPEADQEELAQGSGSGFMLSEEDDAGREDARGAGRPPIPLGPFIGAALDSGTWRK